MQWLVRLQQEGRIDRFEAVALEPNGGDLVGFVLVKGNRESLASLRVEDEFLRNHGQGSACPQQGGRRWRVHGGGDAVALRSVGPRAGDSDLRQAARFMNCESSCTKRLGSILQRGLATYFLFIESRHCGLPGLVLWLDDAV